MKRKERKKSMIRVEEKLELGVIEEMSGIYNVELINKLEISNCKEKMINYRKFVKYLSEINCGEIIR